MKKSLLTLLVVAASLSSCATEWLVSTGLHDGLVGLPIEEFQSGFMADGRRNLGSLIEPTQVTEEKVGDAHYEFWKWAAHRKRGGAWDHWEWVAFRNGVVVQVYSSKHRIGVGISASAIEKSYNERQNFGKVPRDQLSSIRTAAIQQSETDPICGMVRGPQYGADALIAIVRSPQSSPWRYQGVVLEYRLPHVVGEIDFYLNPRNEGAYVGKGRLWNVNGVTYAIARCEVTLQSRGAAEFKTAIRGEEVTSPLRLINQEARSGSRRGLPAISSGTGWLEAHGFVVTNHHVIQGARSIEVVFSDGRKETASVAAHDAHNDLALLRLNSSKLPPGLRVRDAAAVLGEGVITLGYPLTDILGDSIKMGRGSVSAVAGLNDDTTRIQIDAPVHPGNSGGPVLSMDGEVLGVVVSRVKDSVVIRKAGVIAQNINYAIKVGYLHPLLSTVLDKATHKTVQVKEGAAVEDVVKAVQRSVVRIRCKRKK